MVNNIQNLTATGAFQEAPAIPHGCASISIQARSSAEVQYRFRGQTDFWTIKADTTRTLIGEFYQGDLFVQAVAPTVIELEYSTKGFSA